MQGRPRIQRPRREARSDRRARKSAKLVGECVEKKREHAYSGFRRQAGQIGPKHGLQITTVAFKRLRWSLRVAKSLDMTVHTSSSLAKKLQAAYNKNKLLKILMDHLSQRGKNPKNGYTSVEAALQVLHEVDGSATPADARGVLEELAGLGCGTFRVGRRGWPTRIDWEVDAISAGKAAKGDAPTVEPTPSEGGVRSGMTEVEFPLREDLLLTFVLPKDLTEKEAERLGAFLRSLPR